MNDGATGRRSEGLWRDKMMGVEWQSDREGWAVSIPDDLNGAIHLLNGSGADKDGEVVR